MVLCTLGLQYFRCFYKYQGCAAPIGLNGGWWNSKNINVLRQLNRIATTYQP